MLCSFNNILPKRLVTAETKNAAAAAESCPLGETERKKMINMFEVFFHNCWIAWGKEPIVFHKRIAYN